MAQMGGGEAMQAQNSVSHCLQTNQEVLQVLFREELRTADVADFSGAVQQVDAILRKIATQAFYSKCSPQSLSLKIFLRSLDKLSQVLDEYSGTLQQLAQTQQLVKVLNSVNLRRRLEQLNGSLLTEASILDEKHAYLGRETGPTVVSQPDFNGDYNDASPAPEPAEAQNIPISDDAARHMWATMLEGTFMVEWPKFVEALTTSLNTTLSVDQKKVVKQILDNNNTGFVSAAKFNEFIRGFGPYAHCLHNVDQLLQQPWFFGFLTMDEAKKFLEFQPVNTYLVRFSGTKPGSFALAFASGPQKVSHVHITTTENGFSVKQQDEEKVFSNLYEIVEFYNTVLKTPFQSQLPYETWFHGDIDSTQADKYLQGKKVGTFLIRFSSQPGYFAGSYVDENHQVGKCLIASSPRFYIADNEGSQYGQFDTMSDLVLAFESIFKFPYKKGTNDQQEQMREKIAKELLETEKSYTRAMRTVESTFMREFDPNAPGSKKLLSPQEFQAIFCNSRDLAETHERLTSQLDPVISQWHEESMIGQILTEFNDKLTVYTPYVNNYNNSMSTLTKCMARANFRKHMEALMARPEVDQNNYTAYTIQPIQRVPRYILLISDLLKHTDDSHPDYDGLKTALDVIKISADDINDKKRIADNMAQLQEMNERLSGSPNFTPSTGRSVVHDGELKEKEGKKYTDRVCWVLDDAIVVSKPAKKSKKDTGPGKCVFKAEIPLRGAYVTDIPDGKVDKNAFKVTSGGIECVFCTEQPGPKQFWMSKITGAAADVDKVREQQIERSNTMTIVSRGMAAPQVAHQFQQGSPGSGSSSPSSSGGSISAVQQQIPGRANPGAVQRSYSMGSGVSMGNPGPKPPSFQSATGAQRTNMRSSAGGESGPQRATSFGPGMSPMGSGPGTPQAPRQQPGPGSPVAQAGGPLPAGWKEAYSADGRLYFYNTITKKTSWKRPVAEQAPAQLPPEWREARTPEGKVYWYNTQTKETTWQRPG
jgi:RhoGEF domain/WW domain/SH2 domain/CBL proto-oncogene N-terminus, EF hand-like domain